MRNLIIDDIYPYLFHVHVTFESRQTKTYTRRDNVKATVKQSSLPGIPTSHYIFRVFGFSFHTDQIRIDTPASMLK